MWRGKTSHLDKFKASLAVRLPDVWPDDQVEAFVNYWADAIKLAWMTSTPQVCLQADVGHAHPASLLLPDAAV